MESTTPEFEIDTSVANILRFVFDQEKAPQSTLRDLNTFKGPIFDFVLMLTNLYDLITRKDCEDFNPADEQRTNAALQFANLIAGVYGGNLQPIASRFVITLKQNDFET